jgi:hypothetical protein
MTGSRIAPLVLAAVIASSAPGAASAGVDALAWMAGHWEMTGGGKHVEEVWMSPEGGVMLGMSRTVKEGRAVGFEFLRLEERGEAIFYVASPGGAPPTDFRLVESSGTRAVFENPAHDFPQRIEYRRDGEALVARISALGGSAARASEWRWTRREE